MCFFVDSRRAGRVFKSFLGAVGFVLPEFGPERRKKHVISKNLHFAWNVLFF